MRRLLIVTAFAVIFAVPAHAAEAPTSLSEVLGPGSTGPEVSLLQTWLSEIPNLYPEKKITGTYDRATERAVIAYQKVLGIVSARRAPGIVGSFTRATLNARFSENQGGVAWVEGEYADALLWNGKEFKAPPAKEFKTDAVVARLSAWVYPSVLPGRQTVLFTDGNGRTLGLDGGKIFVRSPGSTDVVTGKSYVTPGMWHHISVILTADNAIFLHNNTPVEAGVLTLRPLSFFGRIAALFSSLFPQAKPAYRAPSAVERLTTKPAARPTGFIPFLSSSSPIFPSFPAPSSPPVKAKPIAASTTGSGASAGTVPKETVSGTGAGTTTTPLISVSTSTASVATSSVATVVSTTTAATSSSSSGGGGGGGGGGAAATQGSSGPSVPVITLLGSPSVTIATGDGYTDPGATATSPTDGNITSSIVTTGSVNQYIPGTYTIYYDVTDSRELEATTVSRTVTVTAPSPLPPEAQQPNYTLAPAGQAVSLSVDSNADVYPRFVNSSITPLHVYVGDTQTYTVKVTTAPGAEVTSVTATTRLDSHTLTFPLTYVSTDSGGATFSASWVVFDTHNNIYRTTFTATDSEGRTNSITMAWSDPCSGVTQGVDSSLSANCNVSGVYGLDGATVTVPNGITLTLNASATWGFNPGTSILLTGTGSIVKGSGASIKKGYLFYLNGSPVDTNTMYWFSTTPQTGYTRVNAYSQGSYYSEGYYQGYYQSGYQGAHFQ